MKREEVEARRVTLGLWMVGTGKHLLPTSALV